MSRKLYKICAVYTVLYMLSLHKCFSLMCLYAADEQNNLKFSEQSLNFNFSFWYSIFNHYQLLECFIYSWQCCCRGYRHRHRWCCYSCYSDLSCCNHWTFDYLLFTARLFSYHWCMCACASLIMGRRWQQHRQTQ